MLAFYDHNKLSTDNDLNDTLNIYVFLTNSITVITCQLCVIQSWNLFFLRGGLYKTFKNIIGFELISLNMFQTYQDIRYSICHFKFILQMNFVQSH